MGHRESNRVGGLWILRQHHTTCQPLRWDFCHPRLPTTRKRANWTRLTWKWLWSFQLTPTLTWQFISHGTAPRQHCQCLKWKWPGLCPYFFVGVTVSSKLTDCSYVLIWSYFDISYDLLRALYLGFPFGFCKHADKTNAVYFHLNAGVLPLSQDDCPVYMKILFLLNSFGKYVGMHF